MVLLLILILPLLEDEKRPSKHVCETEWMTNISDCTSNIGRFARPPPASMLCEIRACQALQNIIPEAWESIESSITVYSKTTPPTRRKQWIIIILSNLL